MAADALSASTLTVGPAVLSSPPLGQIHRLTPKAIALAPALPAPPLAEIPEPMVFRPLAGSTESLEWLTEVLQARTGEQRIAQRKAPRQSFSFALSLTGRRL